MTKRLTPYLIAAVALAVILAGVFVWYWLTRPAPPPVNQYVTGKVARQLNKVPQVIIHPGGLKVYAPAAKAKLNLPPELQQNQNAHVLAATTVKSDLHPQTIVTTIDEKTGESTTIVRRDPYPWIALDRSGEIRIDYGIKRGLEQVARLTFRQEFLQVKAMHLGITATLDSDGQGFAGVGVGYRW